jgi:hypothetical protein
MIVITFRATRLIRVKVAARYGAHNVSMNQLHVHVRVVLAALSFGLVLALGLASVSAGSPSPCVESVSLHHADNGNKDGFALGFSHTCEEQHCADLTPDCCTALSGGACCGFGAVAPGGTPGATEVRAPGAAWLTLPVASLAGVDSSVGRRPPRA